MLNELGRIIENHAGIHADQTYLWADTETPRRWTYGQLADDVAARMTELRDAGVHAGDRVALVVAHPGEFVVTWLAIMVLDAIAVPISPRAPEVDRNRTLHIAGANWVIADCSMEVPESRGWLELVNGHITSRRVPPARIMSTLQGGGNILLTSGTTGDPKPVGLPLSSLLHTAQVVVESHQLSSSDIGFSPLPLFHINAEVVAVLGTLLAGAQMVLPMQFHASRFWDIANRYNVSWINAVPSILTVMVQREGGPDDTSRLRFIRSASAPLPVPILQRVEQRWHIPVIETYGLSEAASQVAANPLYAGRAGSVGVPTGTAIRIVDEQGIPCPVGTVGQVEIQGPSVVDPHWGPNRWAASKSRGGWYQTGDLGRFDSEGYLYLEGRLRELINRGGEKIFPREVEEWLLTHPGVADCAVVGRPHPLLGEEPVAFIVPVDGTTSVADELTTWVPEHLSRFKCPAEYFVVNSLPKGATGKISRLELRKRVTEKGAGA